MHEPPLLINITIALIVAFLGGVLARRIGLPAIVGYLLAGIVIGPFTPGFVGDVETIQQLAELGVIFLMFGVGLHFSFQDLWRVRDIAIPGSLAQTTISTLLGLGLSQLWGWSIPAGIVLGLAISVASTVVLLRGLMDNSLLNTSHGQVAVGWLVMEDILSVLILVLMPVLVTSQTGFQWQPLAITLVKAGVFIAIMFFAGTRFIPWLLDRIAFMRSRELFILVILAIALGTALGAAEWFGVSLALGAFVAGAIISQSHLSHQVGADVLPFREAFAVLFFVSVGMLVNPRFLWANLDRVLVLTTLIIAGKAFVTLLLGFFFPRPALTFLVVAVGLSQIGEFSFILGQGGMALGLLDLDQYSLILAGALISITFNPFMYRLLPVIERWLRGMPGLWRRLDLNRDYPMPDESHLKGHVVIVGYGRVGKNLAEVLESIQIPVMVIETDPERIDMLNRRKTLTLYGDAANSEVITHAGLLQARALVVMLPEETSGASVIAAAKEINPDLPIIARAASEEGLEHMARLGARHAILPELEGGLEIIHLTLLELGFPLREVFEYSEAVRHDRYDFDVNTGEEQRTLSGLLRSVNQIGICWITLETGSPILGQSLMEANIRSRSGASIVALMRGKALLANPKSAMVFEVNDRVGLIGDAEQIEMAKKLML